LFSSSDSIDKKEIKSDETKTNITNMENNIKIDL
jgi:hypothetical protein